MTIESVPTRELGRVVFTAESLVKVFPGVRALDEATLVLKAGSVHALLGENGAGKSTLIKILTGVYQADGGRLVLNDDEVRFTSPHQSAGAGIGVVHQERNLISDFSIAENIMLQNPPAKHGVIDRDAMRTVARRCLDMLDLDLDVDQPVLGLSVAQMQLIEIAKALSMDTQVLLLDEPTASITPSEAENLFGVMRRLADQGKAIVFVSHKLEEVFRVCDTVTVLRDGRSVLEAGTLSEYSRSDVINAMVGRTHETLALTPREVDRTAVPALSLRHVTTAAGHQDISFDVYRGEIYGLYGLVGAGRTELAKSLIGLEEVTSGELRVGGEVARIKDVRHALDTYSIGYVPEDRKNEGLFLEQPVSRNVAVTVWDRIRRLGGYVPARRENQLVEEYVEKLSIRVSSPNQYAGLLSGGNQQKVSLAKWLAAQTEILIIDEPTVGIDIRAKGAIHQIIWDLAGQGLAVLLISSDLPEMVELADRIAVMRDFTVQGEVENTHAYAEMSRAVINLIHREPAGLASGEGSAS
jgi:ribose transport system ATP-binding protein